MTAEPLDLDAIYQRWMRTGADCNFQVEECRCEDSPHDNALHDLALDDVPVLLAECDRLAADLAAEREKVQRIGEFDTEDRVQTRCEHPASGWIELCPPDAPHADYLLIRRADFRAALAREGGKAEQPQPEYCQHEGACSVRINMFGQEVCDR